MCDYYSRSVAVIHTPSLCEDPSFDPAIVDNLNTVLCRLIVPDNEESRMVYMEAIGANQRAQQPNLDNQELSDEEKVESEALFGQEALDNKDKQSSKIFALVNKLDIPDDVKDKLATLLADNAEIFPKDEHSSQELDSAQHFSWDDVRIVVDDDL